MISKELEQFIDSAVAKKLEVAVRVVEAVANGKYRAYRCTVCNNTVILINAGKGTLTCCGRPMEIIKDRSLDISRDGYFSIVNISENWILIKTGSLSVER